MRCSPPLIVAFCLAIPPLHAQATRATVEVAATTRQGVALAGVAIEVTAVGGKTFTVVTDSSGRAQFADLDPGTTRVIARKIGFAPGGLFGPIGAGRNTFPLILDPVAAPTLAEVRIVAGREMLARHAEFEERHSAKLATASFTAADIRKRNVLRTWEMLRMVPSVAVAGGRSGSVRAASTRSPCDLRLIVDGVERTGPGNAPGDLGDLPPPSEIHGIEVFAGPASVPAKYNSPGRTSPTLGGISTCGLIAVWTK